MKQRSFNAFVVSGGGYQGLTIIKGLRNNSAITIIMADSSNENIGKYFVDKFYCIPSISETEAYIHSLITIALKEHVDIVFPSTDIELNTLAKHIELFSENNVRVAVSPVQCLEFLCSKKLLYDYLENNNFPILPAVNPFNPDTPYPIIGKPVKGWGSKGLLVLHSSTELNRYGQVELLHNYVWQKFLPYFEEYSIDCAIGFDGKISPFTIRNRIKTVSGFAVISESVTEPEINLTIVRFLRELAREGACGIFNVQILKDASGFYFSDVNPRIGTSAVFSNKAAANLPLFLCDSTRPELQLNGISAHPKNSIKMVRYLEELWFERKDFRAVSTFVFDLDDTLLNQKRWIYAKLVLLWEQFQKILPSRENFLHQAIWILEEGNRGHLFDAIAEAFSLSQAVKDMLIDAYRTIIPNSFSLYEDVLPTLQYLRSIGHMLVLLTDNPPESQRQKISICSLEKYFDAIVFSRELNEEKPNRKVFDHVSDLLGIPPSAIIMVGDNLYRDIKGAIDAGYAYAYWIDRKGTFFNFDDRLLEEISSASLGDKYSRIGNLREIINELGYCEHSN